MTPNTFVVGAGVETGPSEVSGTVGKTGEGVSGVGVTTWGVGEGFVGGFEGALVGGSPVLPCAGPLSEPQHSFHLPA